MYIVKPRLCQSSTFHLSRNPLPSPSFFIATERRRKSKKRSGKLRSTDVLIPGNPAKNRRPCAEGAGELMRRVSSGDTTILPRAAREETLQARGCARGALSIITARGLPCAPRGSYYLCSSGPFGFCAAAFLMAQCACGYCLLGLWGSCWYFGYYSDAWDVFFFVCKNDACNVSYRIDITFHRLRRRRLI